MPPMLVKMRVQKRGRKTFNLWLPLFLFWLLTLPFMIVTLPVIAVVLLLLSRNPLRVFTAYWRLLSAIPGSQFEAQSPRGFILMQVY